MNTNLTQGAADRWVRGAIYGNFANSEFLHISSRVSSLPPPKTANRWAATIAGLPRRESRVRP